MYTKYDGEYKVKHLLYYSPIELKVMQKKKMRPIKKPKGKISNKTSMVGFYSNVYFYLNMHESNVGQKNTYSTHYIHNGSVLILS